MPNEFYERLRQGLLKQKELEILLHRLKREGYWIGFIRLRFRSSVRKYQPNTPNMAQQDRLWSETRDFYDGQIQQWINNAYRGNTRSKKRWLDDGWQLIGRWERGPDGFLHVHGFLAVYIGPGSALGCDVVELMLRLQERTYHPQIPNSDQAKSIHITEWDDEPKRKAIIYCSKQAWREGTGEDLLFARAPIEANSYQNLELSAT